MGILESASPILIVCTRDRARAVEFYRDMLGLKFTHEDRFAAIFDVAGVPLRVSDVPNFVPHEHTMLGFHVSDVDSTVKSLTDRGVVFGRYPGLPQDDLGILALPDGARVAWFKDPDGNILSVTNQ